MKDTFYDDPNARLHACVRDEDMSTLRELVSRRGTGTGTGTGELDLNYCDLHFGSALQVAILCNNMTAVDILIDAGASPWVCHGSIEPKTTAMDVGFKQATIAYSLAFATRQSYELIKLGNNAFALFYAEQPSLGRPQWSRIS